jgi:ABC-type transporter Mla maintaining outer membrane lipid asymmetry ATPase subunit MlaF
VLTIIGSSGCGKTLLMKLLVGILPLDSGSISIQGKKASEFNTEEEWNRIRLKLCI